MPPVVAMAGDASVLCVDDEPSVLSALRRSLRRLHVRVHVAESGEEALALLAGLPAAELPQVVLSDFRMARMDGVNFLSHVKDRWPLIQRVLITGFADVDSVERAVNEAGIYRFLNKPWEDLSLLSTVRAAVEQWRAADENGRLLQALEDHNRRLEETVDVRTTELTRAQRLWEHTFDAIADPLFVIDGDYRILATNRSMRAHLGLPPEQTPIGSVCHELRARSTWPLARPGGGPCSGCPAARTMADGRAAEGEWSDEIGALVLRTFPLPDGVVCAYRDVTREREATRQLALTDRLAAIGQLAGGVAHEINNPLAGILASSQLMLRDLGAGVVDLSEQREFLMEIESAALRCKATVEHLLRFSRQARQNDVSRVNLNALIEETRPLVERQYALRGVRLRCELASSLPDVLGAAAQLQQVLMNLLGNAFDATSQQLRSGQKEVTAEIAVSTMAAEGLVQLGVRDQGVGIEENSLDRLFLPFFTTKPEGRGAGLGLAVAYGIIADHGGMIHASNLPGGGAEFTVTLPAWESGDP